MKKYLLSCLALVIVLSHVQTASADNLPYDVKVAITKYRAGNYTGCLQDCQDIINRHPSSSIAYYYMAMSYVQAGQKDKAIQAYGKVLNLPASPFLYKYATKGKVCLENPDQCNPQAPATKDVPMSDLDKFINQNSSDVSPDVRKDFEQKHLNRVKYEINNDKTEIKDNKFRQLDNDSTMNDVDKKTNLIAQKPNQQEIDKALKTLNDAGISVDVNNGANPMQAAQTMQMQNANYANPDLMQVQALLGTNQSTGNNSMMDMLPSMIVQNKDGKSNYSPQMVQAMIMNSMMSSVNFNANNDDNK